MILRMVAMVICLVVMPSWLGLLAQTGGEVTLDSTQMSSNPDDEGLDSTAATVRNPALHTDSAYEQRPIAQRNFGKDSWKKATHGLSYPLETEKEKKEERQVSDKSSSHMDISGLIPWFVALKYMIIVAFIGLIVYLIVRLVGEGNVFGRTSHKIPVSSEEIDMAHIEEHLEATDLEAFIRRAIQQKNYPLAIRLYYLAIIKELSAKGAIEWKKDKTNRIYLREMESNTLFDPFRETTRIFERVWYGALAFGETEFIGVEGRFRELLGRIQGMGS